MKIGLLHYSVPPIVGGVEAVLAKHSILMTEAGHQAHVIAGRGKQFDRRITFHQTPLVDSTESRVLAAKNDLDRGKVPDHFEALVSEISSSLAPVLTGLDLIIAHNVCSLHKNLALTAALRKVSEQKNAPRLILWHHDLAWTTPRYSKELHNGYPWDLIRQDWPGSVHVAVSEFRRTQLANLLGIAQKQIHVVPNGVDLFRLLGLEQRTIELTQRLKLSAAAPLILLPVRVTRRKNIELAIRVIAELREHFPQVMLLITGPAGPHNISNREYLMQLKNLREALRATTHVHFLSDIANEVLSDEVISDLFRMSDLLFLPSFEEGFGIPVIEASQTNLPVFCSDIEPLRALAGEEAHYFLPESDPKHVARMIRLFLDESKIFRLRTRLRKYDWGRIYESEIEPLLRISEQT